MKKLTILQGNPLTLGVTRTNNGYNFSFCSECDAITLELYRYGEKEPQYSLFIGEKYKLGNVFAVELSGIDFEKYEYIYNENGSQVTDPYSYYITNGKDFGEDVSDEAYRSGIVRAEFDWEEDEHPDIDYNDLLIYKLHVRGFTKHTSSKVKAKGTFAGVSDKISYIKELGFNSVMLMPPFEFYEYSKRSSNNPYENAGVKKLNYWGYTQGLKFAPKYAYSKNSKQRDYTVEFKKLVKTMHKEGMEVYIELFFEHDVDIALITDCVKYWVLEYHVDGINMCCESDVFERIANEPMLSKTKLFCNYWNNGFVKKYAKRKKTLANMNEGFMVNARRFLKSDEDMLRSFVNAIKVNQTNAANVNFLSNHNTFTLADLVSYDRKHNEDNGENNCDGSDYNYSWNCGTEGKTKKKKVLALRKRQIKNAYLMLLLSQGTPLIMAGDEFLNSAMGNNNPYCQDNEISWINWRGLDSNRDITDFVKTVIAFRKQHRILCMQEGLTGADYKSYGYPDISYHSENAWYAGMETYKRHLGVMYCGKYADMDEIVYIAYNMHWEEHMLAIPIISEYKEFDILLGSGESQDYVIDEDSRYFKIAPRTIAVFVAK